MIGHSMVTFLGCWGGTGAGVPFLAVHNAKLCLGSPPGPVSRSTESFASPEPPDKGLLFCVLDMDVLLSDHTVLCSGI